MSTKAENVAKHKAEHRASAAKRLNAVADDIQELWLNRFIWRTTAKIAHASSAVADQPFFAYWVGAQYGQAACVAVRRLTDNGKRSNSLVSILQAIAENTGAYEVFPWELLEGYRADDGTLKRERVEQDIAELRAAAKKVSDYVNDRLAHLDRNPSAPIPDLEDLDSAIELLGTTLKRYLLIVTSADLHPITPVVAFPWIQVFDRPWVDPTEA